MPLLSLQIAFPEGTEPNGATLKFALANDNGASKLVTGVRAVEQHFTKLLLTRLGSDIYNPDAGTAIGEILRQQISTESILSIKNDLSLSILAVQELITESQEGLILDDSEILESVDIQLIDYVEELGWQIQIKLNMADGNAGQVLLGN